MELLTFPIITINPSDASGKEGQGAACPPMGSVFLHLSAVLVQLSVHSYYGLNPDSVRKKENLYFFLVYDKHIIFSFI